MVANDQPALFRELLERHPELKSAINEPVASFDSPLINHVRSREMLDVLLAAGADINAESRWWAGGFSLLDSANPELAAYAIERGANVDVHAAARLGRFDKLVELVTGTPELVHARGGDGQTPLHFAATVEIADYLLQHGAAIDALDVDHESTPAQYMVRDRQAVARRLIERGARSDILLASALGDIALVARHLQTDPGCIHTRVSERFFPKQNPRSGCTIYNWTLGRDKAAAIVAHEFGHEDVFRLLIENSPDELRLSVACEVGDEAAIRALLARRPDVIRTLDGEDCARVAHAARDNKTDTVRLMLGAGWPVDARGQHGATPLHWAAFHGNVTMAEIILRHRPPLEAVDNDFVKTPLGWAKHGSEHGWHCRSGNYAATIDALRRAGAKDIAS